MIRVDCEGSLHSQLVPITPAKDSGFPVKICAISVGCEQRTLRWQCNRRDRHEPVFYGLIGSGYDAISSLDNQGSSFCVVQVKGGDLFQTEKRLEVKLEAWSQSCLERNTPITI